MLDELLAMGGGSAVQQVAQRLGIDEAQARSAIGAVLPALQGGVRNQISQPGGLDALAGSIGSGSFDRFSQDPSALAAPEVTGVGNDILGQLLGGKDASRQLASNAAEQTGIGADVIKQMLPVVATMLMSGLSQKAGAQSQLAGLNTGSNDLMGSLASMLDADKDGSAVDDIMGMAQKFFEK
jgi:hypothetical protein